MSHNSGYIRHIASTFFVAALLALGVVAYLTWSKKHAEQQDGRPPTASDTTDDASSLGEGSEFMRSEEPGPQKGTVSLSELERTYRYDRHIQFDPAREPDWKLRREFYREFLHGKFTPPLKGEELTIPLISNGSISGTMVATNTDFIVIQAGQTEIEVANSQLSAAGRALFFEPDALEWNATQQTLREREQWRSKKAKLEENAKRAASPRSAREGRPPPPGEPRNRPPDGSVYQVVAYLEKRLPDPVSTEYLEWSEVGKAPEGFRVRCKYKTKKTSGDSIIRNQLFVMDGNGKILKVLDPNH